jgi:hypothetical protein
MADLERRGYLEKPHTSAARVPSQKAYRFYVDRLHAFKEGPSRELTWVRASLSRPETTLICLIAASVSAARAASSARFSSLTIFYRCYMPYKTDLPPKNESSCDVSIIEAWTRRKGRRR